MRRGPENGAACSLQAPLDSQRIQELNELIEAGWGNIPQPKIPANWRELAAPAHVEIVDEVHDSDIERIKAEQNTPVKRNIAEIERQNFSAQFSAVHAIAEAMAQSRRRYIRRDPREREQELRERQLKLQRAQRSQRHRQAVSAAWRNPEKFQSRRPSIQPDAIDASFALG